MAEVKSDDLASDTETYDIAPVPRHSAQSLPTSKRDSALNMFSNKHLLVEMHEIYDESWHETHRWNHGLQMELEHYESSESWTWTRPHLPSVSLTGMVALRTSLTYERIWLEVDDIDASLEVIADDLFDRLQSTGRVSSDERGLVREKFVERIRSRSGAKMGQLSTMVSSPGKDEVGPGRQSSADSVLCPDEPIIADPGQEHAQILVLKLACLREAVLVLVRLREPVCIGLEDVDGSSRFVILVIGPEPSQDDDFDSTLELARAMAAQMQDDRVVSILYKAKHPNDVILAIEDNFLRMRLLPHTALPTKDGINRRARKMLDHMLNRAGRMSQTEKWNARQANIFEYGVNMSSLVTAMQKYAIPLLSGIVLGVIGANLLASDYEHWFGSSHGSGSGDGSSAGSSVPAVSASAHPTILGLSIRGHDITLKFVVNDLFMCAFFGLAAREIAEAFQPGGTLYPPTRTTVNILASTVGGVLGPVAVYISMMHILHSLALLDDAYEISDYTSGWGIPTATDISLAWVTALCVFGRGHLAINYLLLLAIVDDAIGLIIIAIAYPDPTSPMQPVWLLLVVAATLLAIAFRRLRVSQWQLYVFTAGPLAWFGLLYAALHPALALCFVVPFIPVHIEGDAPEPDQLDILTDEILVHHGKHPLHEFEEATKLFVDFVVLFSFGLANAGVELGAVGPVTAVVLAALIGGKTLGISLASAVASKCFGCPPPAGMGIGSIATVGFIAGAGLTVAIFVAGEAYSQFPELAGQAKMGALMSIFVCVVAVLGGVINRRCGGQRAEKSEQEPLEEGVAEDTDGAIFDTALSEVVVKDCVNRLQNVRKAQMVVEKKVAATGRSSGPGKSAP